MTKSDLSDVAAYKTNFNFADLKQSDLRYGDFTNGRFCGTNLTEIYAYHSDFSFSDFSDAITTNAQFGNAKLSFTGFSGPSHNQPKLFLVPGNAGLIMREAARELEKRFENYRMMGTPGVRPFLKGIGGEFYTYSACASEKALKLIEEKMKEMSAAKTNNKKNRTIRRKDK
jgi:uncharacterized protein YjbI with pentapeptide repeats